MRYRLRTLLIMLAILPPVLAASWFVFQEYRKRMNENAVWEGELSLIHGSGQTVEPDPDDQASHLPPD